MKKIWIFVLPLLLAACSSKLNMVELTDWQFFRGVGRTR